MLTKRHLPRILYLLCFFATIAPLRSQEQSTFQVWVEETAVSSLADRWVGSLFLTQYFVDGSRKYASVSVCPAVSFAITPWLLAEGALFMEYADQSDISDIIELRPYVALRYTDVISRFEPYVMLRQEFRNLYYLDTKTWQDQYRLRLRIGSRIAITDERIAPNSLYAIAEVEFFENLDPAPKEYFNSRIRLHAGLGYRFGDLWTGELYYMAQRFRSYPNQPFDSQDNILRFTVRKAF